MEESLVEKARLTHKIKSFNFQYVKDNMSGPKLIVIVKLNKETLGQLTSDVKLNSTWLHSGIQWCANQHCFTLT